MAVFKRFSTDDFDKLLFHSIRWWHLLIQETVDFKLLIRYKKASTEMEEAYLMGFSGGSEEGKLVTALLQLDPRISIKTLRVNPKPAKD
ncbi:MAG: hypothetical protein ISS65_07755 [Desulfobacterales bacterium]|uniref:Uncharacterized protein n=1 Tax=Candidatus Desulfatibia profunda TaxID=2841695 RepID=A0A8J6NMX0_9BACT|nr:hypothetical protein [Candidatus Desulfatibia profunda]MBL7180089.1 hypothetical protein [Desulfobacterales bacterium]